jgi:exodeoxyribonuclease III
MRIISYNTNGIRAAIKKGLLDWLKQENFDIICIQETKATQGDVDTKLIEAMGYHHYWFSAQKKGYSSVAVFTKTKPLNVVYGNGFTESDFEGRVLQLDFEKFTLLNIYFPSGTSGTERQAYKYQFLNEINEFTNKLKNQQPNIILCGDYNICHKEIDIHDPKGNKNSSGFLPEERLWMDDFFNNGFIDSFRQMHPQKVQYSWWSQRFPSVRLQNKGWRIDYFGITKPLVNLLQEAEILDQIKHSDHCPIYIKIKV